MKPLIIGIAGGTGSGKSTFSGILKKQLADKKVSVINMDKYYKNPVPKMVSPITQSIDDDWNSPDSVDHEKLLETLQSLKAESAYDIIIIEGILLFCYNEIRELLDLKIFIELDADERMHRRIKRNTNNLTENVEYHVDYYLHYAKHQEQKFALPSKIYADIIVNGNNLDGKALDVLFAWIRLNAL